MTLCHLSISCVWCRCAEQLTTDGNASIECVAFGDPPPDVSWFKDSHRLSNKSVSLMDVNDGRYVISHVLLRHVTIDDAGDYK